MTLTPGYGRDYASKKAAVAAFEAGKDFIVADLGHPSSGKLISKPQIVADGLRSVNIRYKRLTMIAVVKVAP
jgi:predicted TIM-barrel enzyme